MKGSLAGHLAKAGHLEKDGHLARAGGSTTENRDHVQKPR